jgi:hypothetical protein
MQKAWQSFVDQLIAQRRVFDRKRNLHAPQKIPRHPIRARQKDFRLSIVGKVIDPAVLEEPANDAKHANVFA